MKIEDSRRMNCIKLMIGLLELEFNTQFTMRHYAMLPESVTVYRYLAPQQVQNGCGTSGCFLGHGPLCGILPETLAQQQRWESYCTLFVPREYGLTWDFLFSQKWSNRKSQSIARMHRYLSDGVPKYHRATSTYHLPLPAHVEAYKKELKTLEAAHAKV